MFKIHKLNDFSKYDEMIDDFIFSLDNFKLNESDKSKDDTTAVYKKILKDLKLNISLIGVFGSAIAAFYPIVENLMSNVNVELTTESVVLATICAISIIYLEEKKIKQEQLTKDSKSMLEELKLRGIGNGIVKKIISSLQSIKNIFSLITKHAGIVISGFVDMFAYTSLLIPILNAVGFIIGKYDLNLDSLTTNFTGLAMGIGTITTKQAIIDIINRLKDKINLKKDKIISEIETPVIQKFSQYDKSYDKTEIIQEQ